MSLGDKRAHDLDHCFLGIEQKYNLGVRQWECEGANSKNLSSLFWEREGPVGYGHTKLSSQKLSSSGKGQGWYVGLVLGLSEGGSV